MRILIYTAIIGMFLSVAQDWVAIGSFKLNQKEIADRWCVNKEKKSCCKGKCFLSNVLDDLHDEDNQSGALPELVDRLPFLPLAQSFSLSTLTIVHNSGITDYNNHLRGILCVHDIFHPPQI